MVTDAKSILGKLSGAKSAMRELSEGVTSIRDQIRSLKGKRRKVASTVVSHDVALERMEKWVDHVAQQAKAVAPEPARFAGSEDWSFPAIHYPETQAAMLMAYLSPHLLDAAKDELAAFYEGKPTLTERERHDQVAAIDRQLLDAELTEESLIRAAEAEGFPIARRQDADIFALLAHDEVLP